MLHTHSASTKVIPEPMRVATEAGQRNTASMTSSDTTGISATRHVSVRLLSGSSTWVNMAFPLTRNALSAPGGRGSLLLLRPALSGGGQTSTGAGQGSTAGR